MRILAFFVCVLFIGPVNGQTSLTYMLSSNLEESQGQHEDLKPLANIIGETGYFDKFIVPVTTCPSSFDVDGYHFFDNAGLRFENNKFVDCEYTIQFTFHIKELSGPEAWVRLINFMPSDDSGIYIKITNSPTSGTLEFYPNGVVGTADFFNAKDLYQFIITRTCAGLVNIYVNGEFFASYDDSSSPLYLVHSTEDIIDFFQDDTAIANEASPGWVKNIVISDFASDIDFVKEEWEKFCEVLQETDCAGTPNGTSIIDECGNCLEMNDPNFNKGCDDCAGVMSGLSVVDSCGVCLLPDDPDFNQSCADCAGTPSGEAIIDSCGVCLVPTDPDFNQSCVDCAGTPNGAAILDECGVCLLPDDPSFNQSCLDCMGVINGTAVIDECGYCLEPSDPSFNTSCSTEFFFPTAFSPNQDGINDYFEVFKSSETPANIKVYRIFNLWGELIHESMNFEFGETNNYWDGSWNGQNLNSGVYIYYIEFLFENGTVKSYSGDVFIAK